METIYIIPFDKETFHIIITLGLIVLFTIYLILENWVDHSANIQWLKERRKEYEEK